MNRHQTDPEQIKKLYSSIDDKNLSLEEMYKYLTQNDPDILDFKERVLLIVQEKGLGSYMNDSKWLRLQREISKLEFAPAYLEKLVTDDEFRYANVNTDNNTSFGDWSPYYMEGMPLFFNIEYLVIIPTFVKYVGRLVEGKTVDNSENIRELLTENNIPFELDSNNFVVYGYK